VVLLAEDAHPLDVAELGLRIAEVRVSPAALDRAYALLTVFAGERGGRHVGLYPQTSLDLRPRDSDEPFHDFAVRCRRSLLSAMDARVAGAIVLVTHARNAAICEAWARYGERGLNPLFEDAPRYRPGIVYRFHDRAWHPTRFGR